MIQKLKNILPHLAIILAWFAPPVIVGSMTLRPEFIVGSLIMGLILFFSFMNPDRIFPNCVNIWLLGFIVSMIVSGLYSVFFLGGDFSLRDTTEVVRVGYYFLLFNISFNTASIKNSTISLRLQIIGLLAVIGFSVLQYVNFAGINQWLTPIYATPDQMLILNSAVPRVVGTLGNSNLLGFVLACSAAIILSFIVHGRLKGRYLLALSGLLALTLVNIIITFSRTALALALVGIVLPLVAGFFVQRNFNKVFVYYAFGIICLATLAIFFAPEGFFTRLSYVPNITHDPSFIDRISMWQGAWEYIRQSPIFGWGPAKQSMATFLDNEYILVLRRYGAVGLLCYLGIFLSLFLQAWNSIRKGSQYLPIAVGFIATVVLSMAFSITAGMFYNIQMSTLFWVLAGIFLGLRQAEGENTPIGK